MQDERTAKWTAGLGALGALYFGGKLVMTCLEPREIDRYCDGCVAATKIYAKVAVGAGAVLAGGRLWEVTPRGMVPLWAVGAATPIPFLVYASRNWRKLFTAENNKEWGVTPLVGCGLGGYFLGPALKMGDSMGLLRPWVLLTYSILVGHSVAVNTSKEPLQAILQTAPASLSFASALAPLTLGRDNFQLYGEPMLQCQVILSSLLSIHTYWCLKIGNPLHFDTTTHALGILGSGVYTGWAFLRMIIRTASLPVTETLNKIKYGKYFADAMSWFVLCIVYLLVARLGGSKLLRVKGDEE